MSESGGTLTLPSPTHPHHHHVDVQAGFRTLRRSLSRSPSKFSLARTASQSSSDAGSSPSSPSSRRAQSQSFGAGQSTSTPSNLHLNHTQSPLATPFRPGAKLSLRSAKSASRSPLCTSTTTRAQTRTRTSPRTSPRSPSRRVLTTTSSTGNSTPSFTPTMSYGQENMGAVSTRSSATRKSTEKTSSRQNTHLDLSVSCLGNLQPLPEASPVKKRNDATMNLNQPTEDTPNPKRRSYGPTNLEDGFDIFNQFSKLPSPTEIEDDLTDEYDWSNYTAVNPTESLHSMTPAPALRRTGSLRKSTLQQRYSGDRGALSRRTGVSPLSTASPLPPGLPEAATPINMNRPRLSMDSFMPPPSRDSPFADSSHPLGHTLQPAQPHPLSRTVTTSSSASSFDDESPTHFPTHVEKPKARMIFSKSLPLGAVRPKPDHSRGPLGSVSTPDYKYVKPFEGAFASTGLVSKMIRNPEDKPISALSAAVPDTPCKKVPPGLPKKPSHGYATYPLPPPTGLAKRGGRSNRHHGSPTTPFSRSTSDEPPRPVLFQGFNSRHSRKGSLLSLYSDDGRSPTQSFEEMDTCDDGSMPPTPTKNQLLSQSSSSLAELSYDSPTTSRLLTQPTTNNDLFQAASPMERLELAKQVSPRTPNDGPAPDTSSSASNSSDSFLCLGNNGRSSTLPPATPTARQSTSSYQLDRRVITPVHGMNSHELDPTLLRRFGKVEFIGRGEFSEVYKVTEMNHVPEVDHGFFLQTPSHQSYTPASPPPEKVFAVKRLVLPFQGDKDRKLRLREVDVLKRLVGCDHILQLVHNWEENHNLYIQTEFCEEGNLNQFLTEVGVKGRLDDFRIWKIMIEMTEGLKHIHSAGFVHRDLKPSNVLVGFDGTLKIGDFGLATSLQETCDASLDLDGDREYLAPEALRSEIDTPIDIFSLGLIMLEIAANVKLPENGATWTALREDDFSEIPVLTQVGDAVQRDAEGMPLDETERNINPLDNDGSSAKSNRRNYIIRSGVRQSGDIFGLNRTGSSRKTELQEPPPFMSDPEHPSSLDTVVRRMLAAVPILRFTVPDLLQLEALNWVGHRRRAGATVFEGNWGPGDEVVEPLFLDTEMTDV
ncbi:hypothetical protein GGR50DRAFT_341035 [Xylaria sp. CBS 124048]|nr:hypothetical protein GGR50DRAFT_341035 [Xylaria sp. CBS 124048]